MAHWEWLLSTGYAWGSAERSARKMQTCQKTGVEFERDDIKGDSNGSSETWTRSRGEETANSTCWCFDSGFSCVINFLPCLSGDISNFHALCLVIRKGGLWCVAFSWCQALSKVKSPMLSVMHYTFILGPDTFALMLLPLDCIYQVAVVPFFDSNTSLAQGNQFSKGASQHLLDLS